MVSETLFKILKAHLEDAICYVKQSSENDVNVQNSQFLIPELKIVLSAVIYNNNAELQ